MAVTQAFFVCQPGATALIANKTRASWSNNPHPPHLDHARLSTAGYKVHREVPKNRSWTTGTPVVNVILVREAIASHQQVEQTNLMKANTTRNLTSVVMLAITTPLLALAILVSIKTAGIRDNEVLLVLFTLSSAVLSGINGFGRRAPTTVTQPSQARSHLSARSSNNA
ncbi:MAG TPA: hypothetical protein VM656_07075 [Pyrinomonadaceae bacterium]|nr:hypothetical protein [Pyrinomonadaceae bacterium]